MHNDARSSARNAIGAVDGQPGSRAPVGGWGRTDRRGVVPDQVTGAEVARVPAGEVEGASAKVPGAVGVAQLRLAVTAEDYDHALRFYRDVLGMPELGAFASPAGGRVTILDAGRATLELADPPYAAYIDEVEVGRRVAGPIRVALEVTDAAAATGAAEAAGARVLAPPTTTPWNSSNARLEAPAGLQLTLFAELGDSE
jgi:lactoylglutathione lyase